jgi:hypothetical protein
MPINHKDGEALQELVSRVTSTPEAVLQDTARMLGWQK